MAASDTSTASTAATGQKMCPGGRNSADMQEVVTGLVGQGSLSQDQADKLLTLIKNQEDQWQTQKASEKTMTPEERKAQCTGLKGQKTGPFSEAVTQGIITQEQATAIQEAMQAKNSEQRQANMTSKLQDLVSNGTLTSTQSDAILTQINSLTQERQTEMDKIKTMTQEEHKAYLQANRPQKTDMMKSLVDNGTLTQEQATAVQEALQGKNTEQRQANLTGKLQELVSNGTLTSTQSDAIINQINSLTQQRQTEMDKVKSMTQEERKAYLQANRPQKTDILKSLVDDGTLTQEQADAVSKVFPFGNHRSHGGAERYQPGSK